MSYEFTPYARVECHLSTAGMRDAVRKGVMVGEYAVHELDPEGPDWDRFFEFEPELVYDDGRYDSTSNVVQGAVLVVGRPIEVNLEDSDTDYVQIGQFDFVEWWQMPRKELVLGAASEARRFDVYLSVSELLDIEAESRSNALQRSDDALGDALGRWRKWVDEHGLAHVIQAISAGESVDPKGLTYLQAANLSVALENLRLALVKFHQELDVDLSRAELMQCLASSGPAVGEAVIAATESGRKAEELEQARQWILDKGSSRLRKAIQLDLLEKVMGAYRDERLAAERPGWAWVSQNDQLKDVINPTESDLDALAIAKSLDLSSRLRFRPADRSTWVVGQFLGRRVGLKASSLVSSSYEFDEEPF